MSPLRGKSRNTIVNKTVTYCDGLSGSCLLIRREALEKAGLIPEKYFLFFEEMEWCLNIRNQGYKLAVIYTADVYHKGSATLKKTGINSKYYLARNQVLFVRRNGTTFDLCLFLLTKGLCYLYRRIFSISSRREIRKMEFEAFWEGLTMNKNAQETTK